MNILWTVVRFFAAIATLPRDIDLGIRYLKIGREIDNWTNKGYTIHQIFDEVAARNPDKTAIQHENTILTYKELQEFSLKVANYFQKQGFVKKDIVALMMENQPKYVGVWLGLSRIGVITALINIGLTGDQLGHSVTKATMKPCKAVIVSGSLLKEFVELQKSSSDKKLPDETKFFLIGDTKPEPGTTMNNLVDLETELQKDTELVKPVDNEIVKSLDMSSTMVFVYTSGTEGHPKAAAFTYKRFVFMVTSTNRYLGIRDDDILYTPMPLFHASGGLVGTGQMLLFGTTMVIRTKYSKTAYFPDCKTYKVTVAQYIGEMCTYMFGMKESEADRDHNVRLMFGNGMRKSLYKKFKKRFNVQRIGEFYGSTEGNANMININGKEGAVGFLPWFTKFVYPIYLVEYDEEENKPRRDEKTGFCILAKAGLKSKGLLIGKINPKKAGQSFAGYADEKATGKKIIRDCFKKGDQYFNSGDVLEKDLFNNYYFVDRLGDTFRWQGENVATSQIEEILYTHLDIDPEKVIVYGVEIPNTEGKAGMAAFEMDSDVLDKGKVLEINDKYLTKVQRPRFLRITKHFPTTPTQKIKKTDLKLMKYDPTKGDPTDKVYYLHSPKLNVFSYLPVTEKEFNDIEKGVIKF